MGVNEDEQRQTWKDYMEHNSSALSEVWDKDHSFRRTMGMAGQPSHFWRTAGGRVRWRADRWTAATEAEASALLGTLERNAAAVSPGRLRPAQVLYKLKPSAVFCIPFCEGIATMRKEGHTRRAGLR